MALVGFIGPGRTLLSVAKVTAVDEGYRICWQLYFDSGVQAV